MEEPQQYYQPPMNAYRQEKQESYTAHNNLNSASSAQMTNKYGGEYGYNNYVPEHVPHNQYQPMNRKSYKEEHDALDVKV